MWRKGLTGLLQGISKLARKQNSSPIENLVTLTSSMQWWVGCVKAVVFLRRVASPAATVEVATSLDQIVITTSQMIWRTLASAGQHVLPIACLVDVAISVRHHLE